jgi:hypothetical protein
MVIGMEITNGSSSPTSLFDVYDNESVVRIIETSYTDRKFNEIESLKQRVQKYFQTRELMSSGIGYRRIHRILASKYGQTSLRMIARWTQSGDSPLKKVAIPSIGPALSYCLGALLGDGSLKHQAVKKRKIDVFAVVLRVKDEDFATEFSKAAANALGKVSAPKLRSINNGLWKVEVNGLIMYGLLKMAKKDPSFLAPIVERDQDSISAFLRGCADAEGSAGWYPKSRTSHVYPFANIQFNLVDYVVRLFRKLGIETVTYVRNDPIYNGGIFYVVRVSANSIEKFSRLVGFSIARKKISLEQILARRSHVSFPVEKAASLNSSVGNVMYPNDSPRYSAAIG